MLVKRSDAMRSCRCCLHLDDTMSVQHALALAVFLFVSPTYCGAFMSLVGRSSIPIGTTTFPNQLPEALLAANVGGLGVLLGKSSGVRSGYSAGHGAAPVDHAYTQDHV